MLHRHKHWLAVVLWMGLIFVMSTGLGSYDHTSRFIGPLLRWLWPDIPADTLLLLTFLIRKAAHFCEYAILALLIRRALVSSWSSLGADGGYRLAGLAWLVAAAYAASDEFHQGFVAGRTASFGDVLIDATGAAMALAVVAAWKKWRPRRDSNTRRPV